MKNGKVVAIVGAARCGKSHLTTKLAEHFKVPALYEGEEKDFPPEIIEDMAQNIRPIERLNYFRNVVLRNQVKAAELAASHRFVFLDSTWFNNIPFLNLFKLSDLERWILEEESALDRELLPWPDVIVYVKTTAEKSRELMQRGGRSSETTEEFFVRQIVNSKKTFDEYYANLHPPVPLYTVDRTGLDFDNPSDLQKVIDAVHEFSS